MSIPIQQAVTVGIYLLKQKLQGRKRYPLVLMLEPLFRCNLECLGCGKIQKPQEVLKRYLTPDECFRAAEECGAPIVTVAGGEPLIHPQILEIVEGLLKQGRYVYLCTNALLLNKFLGRLPITPKLSLSIHLDGLEETHDSIVAQQGVFKTVIAAIRRAKEMGYRVTSNTTLFDGTTVDAAAKFFDFLMTPPYRVDGITVSSAFRYEDAPGQKMFFARQRTHDFFKELLTRNTPGRWVFNHSPFYLEFLQGKRSYDCTPWGNPNYSVLGWQRPCYLLDEGYAGSFKELMENTPWGKYGHRNHPQCADCTAHCGYEPTAVADSSASMGNMLQSVRTLFF